MISSSNSFRESVAINAANSDSFAVGAMIRFGGEHAVAVPTVGENRRILRELAEATKQAGS